MADKFMLAFRNELDIIDAQLIELLKQRMSISVQIGAYKRENGLPVYDKARETAVLDRVGSAAGSEYAEALKEVYKTIMCESRKLQ